LSNFVNELKKAATITGNIKLEHLLVFSDLFSTGDEPGEDEVSLVKSN
jgi:hypothetical protein